MDENDLTTKAALAIVKMRDDLRWRSPRDGVTKLRYVTLEHAHAEALLKVIEDLNNEPKSTSLLSRLHRASSGH